MIVMRFGLVAFSGVDMFKRRVIVVGDGVLSGKVRGLIENRGRAHLTSVGFINRDTFSELAGRNEPISELGDLHNSTLGQDSALLRFAIDNKVDEIVVASRERRGLPDFPCRSVGIVEYSRFAETIDPRIATRCISCPPDPRSAGIACAWEFTLKDEVHSDRFTGAE